MRRSWDEDEEVTDLDEPVTITGRQLRSLKRGARVGIFGILLAFVAIGLATWNLLSSTRSAANNDANPSPATVSPTATPGDSGSTAMETATPGAPAAAPQAVQPAVPAPAATSAAPATAAAPAVARPTSASKSTSSTKAAAVRRGRLATAKVAARNAVSTPSASSRQPERGVPIDVPTPALSAPSPAPAPAKAAPEHAKASSPADTAKGH